MPTEPELQQILITAAKGPQSATSLIQHITTDRQPYVFRGLVWLVKLGILKVVI
ncbi:MAG: hypothetical protein ACKN9F_06615 [Methylomonas sp.]